MPHDHPLNELDEAIVRRESVIKAGLVARAIDEALGTSLEAAEAVQTRLLAAGYEQAKRGDWFIY